MVLLPRSVFDLRGGSISSAGQGMNFDEYVRDGHFLYESFAQTVASIIRGRCCETCAPESCLGDGTNDFPRGS
jgi:hypothetical protein